MSVSGSTHYLFINNFVFVVDIEQINCHIIATSSTSGNVGAGRKRHNILAAMFLFAVKPHSSS